MKARPEPPAAPFSFALGVAPRHIPQFESGKEIHPVRDCSDEVMCLLQGVRMRLIIALGAILLSGGCAGMTPKAAWPDPAPSHPLLSSTVGLLASPQGDTMGPTAAAPGRSYQFKCEDQAMRFENTPLPTMTLDSPRREENTSHPLPGSLMEPWKRLASESTMSSPLYWQRNVPGVTDNGFRALSGQYLR